MPHGLPRKLFRVSQLAKYLQLHPNNIRRLIHIGMLPAHRLGKKHAQWRVSTDDLKTFLLKTRTGARMTARAESLLA